MFVMRSKPEMEKPEYSQPFLQNASDDPNEQCLNNSPTVMPGKRGLNLSRAYAVSFHILILVIYSFAFLLAAQHYFASSHCPSEILPLPARKALKWELRPFRTVLVNNPFAGKPRLELEKAWHDLVKSPSP